MTTPTTSLRLQSTVLGAPDPRALAAYYGELLGWAVRTDEPEWVTLAAPDDGAGLSFQREADHVPPVWPQQGEASTAGPVQQMQLHLDVAVEVPTGTDVEEQQRLLDESAARAVALGGRLPDHQPQEDVRVLLDPVGHPFCLFLLET